MTSIKLVCLDLVYNALVLMNKADVGCTRDELLTWIVSNLDRKMNALKVAAGVRAGVRYKILREDGRQVRLATGGALEKHFVVKQFHVLQKKRSPQSKKPLSITKKKKAPARKRPLPPGKKVRSAASENNLTEAKLSEQQPVPVASAEE